MKKDSIFDYEKEYIVDVTNPPIFPPGRQFTDSWIFGMRETPESIRQGEKWNEYSEKYGQELEKIRVDTEKS